MKLRFKKPVYQQMLHLCEQGEISGKEIEAIELTTAEMKRLKAELPSTMYRQAAMPTHFFNGYPIVVKD